MEIERVNDHTIKFFISYRDIEDRGFDREEIWYDRDRGEELFWDMMDEAANEGDFELDGPLWIQVQAFEKGLEIIVTKARLSHDGAKLELPILNDDKEAEISIEYRTERANTPVEGGEKQQVLNDESYLFTFEEFEDIIQLAHSFEHEDIYSDLYVMEDVYYINLTFTESSEENKDQVSRVLEFGSRSRLTLHRLQEYGKRLMKKNALQQIENLFSI